MLDQILLLVSAPPSSIVYHFLVLFSIEAALAMSIGQWLREHERGTLRFSIALLVIGLARAAVVIAALLTWQGFFFQNVLLPPLERTADTLTVLALLWAFVTMDNPVVLRRNSWPDLFAGALLIVIVVGAAGSSFLWFVTVSQGIPYNGLLQDRIWGAAQILIVAVALLWMMIRVGFIQDAFLKAAILIIIAAGAALHQLRPLLGDTAAATRLGMAISMPALAAVTFRHIVGRLLEFDAFDADTSDSLPMPQSVADAIRAMPPTSETQLSSAEPVATTLAGTSGDTLPSEVISSQPGEVSSPEKTREPEWTKPPSDEELDALFEEELDSEPSERPATREADGRKETLKPTEDEESAQPELMPGDLPPDLLRDYPNAIAVVEALAGLVYTLDIREAANHVARAIATALRTDVAAIVSLDEAQQIGVVVAAYDNIHQNFVEGGTIPLAEHRSFVDALGRLKQMRLVPKLHSRELRLFYEAVDIYPSNGIGGPAYVQPLHADQHRLGVLVVGSPYSMTSLTVTERTLLDKLGKLVTASLMNVTKHHTVSDRLALVTDSTQAELGSAQARAQELQVESDEAHQRISDMTAYVEDLQHQLELMELGAQQESTQIKEQRTELSLTLEQIERELETKARTLTETQHELDATRSASQIELAALRARLTTAAISEQEIAILQEQLTAKARQAIEFQTRLTDAEITAETLQRKVGTATGAAEEIQRLEDQIADYKRQVRQLADELAESRTSAGMAFDARQQQVQVEAADREAIAELEARLADRNALIQALEAQLAERTKAIVGMSSNVGNVDDALQGLQQQLAQKTDEVSTLQADLDKTRADAREYIQALEEQLQSSGAQAGDAETYQAMVATLESELGEKSLAVERLQAQLTETTSLLNALESQLGEAATAVSTAVGESVELEAHNEVIASISQELRTPMTSIVGYTDLLLNESMGIIGALQRKILQRVQGSTERMSSLLDNLVSVTALDSGQFELEPERVDVTSILEEAISAAKSQFQDKNLTLRIQIDDGLPSLTADRDALLQIVNHLLSNGILATPVESDVMLFAGHVNGVVPGPDDTEYETACIQISVTDSGGGISLEDQERVFLRKYRADNPLIDGLGDTGVALSIAKTLVEAHGGRIWLESEQGLGSTFSVLLPVEHVQTEGISSVPVE